jgi:hypothetical protein
VPAVSTLPTFGSYTRGSHSHAERPCLRTFHATQRGSLCQDVAEGSSGAHLL